MASEETKITSGSLIASEKVEGTDVYNMQGEKLGTVDDIMLDKVSGKAIYAIMSFGGFLGHRREVPSAALVDPEVRREQGRLRRQSRQADPRECAELRHERGLPLDSGLRPSGGQVL